MYQLTNLQGETVTLTKEHLDRAVAVKLTLQNNSKGRRCNWNQLVSILQEEGYEEAECSENYRCAVKYYQQQQGALPTVSKHANYVATNRIEQLKELTGEVLYEREVNQQILREVNKQKKAIIHSSLLAETVQQSLQDYEFTNFQLTKALPMIPRNEDTLVIVVSDWHIGALVDLKENQYNYEIAKERVATYLQAVQEEVRLRGVKEIVIANIGDMIEQPYMHALAYHCEFTLSEQIVKASHLLLSFINECRTFAPVFYFGIAGNHDRIQPDKKKNIESDHAIRGVNAMIELYSGQTRDNGYPVTYVPTEDYSHAVTIHGVPIKFVHGDLDSLGDMQVINKHNAMDNTFYQVLVMGHYHHHSIKEVGASQTVVSFGSLKGVDGYGKGLKLVSAPSQGMIRVSPNGAIQVRNVKLQK